MKKGNLEDFSFQIEDRIIIGESTEILILNVLALTNLVKLLIMAKITKRTSKAGKIPTLKAEEELKLLKIARYGKLNGNSESAGSSKRKARALKLLVHHNRNLVEHIVRGFYTGGLGDESREEFLSVGIMSILKAVDKFDLDSNKRFATYAGY